MVIGSEQMRALAVSAGSALLAFFTPTHGFTVALLVMFAFNIWCGMRADGVTIVRCKNFSMSKFRLALIEFIMYITINYVLFTVMKMVGDETEAKFVVKILTYIFMYVYLQNAFKNLIAAYPTNKAYRIIYHAIRFEFQRMMPERVQGLIDRLERDNGIEESVTDSAPNMCMGITEIKEKK